MEPVNPIPAALREVARCLALRAKLAHNTDLFSRVRSAMALRRIRAIDARMNASRFAQSAA